MRTAVKRLSVVATIGMFLVLMMGATVTNTGSAEGCGRSWPLCHGQFVPEFVVATLIEYSHRAVTGLEGILIAALAAGSWAFWRQHREVRFLVPLMVGFLLLQSGMGAWAVLSPQTPPVLALHFGISLMAFASVFLTMAFIHELDGTDSLRDRPVPEGYRRLVWGAALFVLFVVYLGAYVRHTGSDLACVDWPLCNGAVIPDLSDAQVANVLAHRLGALGSIIALGSIAIWSRQMRVQRPDLYRGSLAAFGLVLLLALSGGLVVLTKLSLFSTLAHAGIMSLLFASVSYLCLHVLPRARVAMKPSLQARRHPSAPLGAAGQQ